MIVGCFWPNDYAASWICVCSPRVVEFEWLYILLLLCLLPSFSFFFFFSFPFSVLWPFFPNEDIVHSKCGGEEICLEAISLIEKKNHCVNFCEKRAILLALISCAFMGVCV